MFSALDRVQLCSLDPSVGRQEGDVRGKEAIRPALSLFLPAAKRLLPLELELEGELMRHVLRRRRLDPILGNHEWRT